MITQAPPYVAARADERAFVDVLMGCSVQRPMTHAELAALIATMETMVAAMPRTEVRRIATAAVIAERLAAGFGRPDLEMRARSIRADALRRSGDAPECDRDR